MPLPRLATFAMLTAVLLATSACSGSSAHSVPDRSTGGSAATGSGARASVGSSTSGPSVVRGGAALADTGHLIYVLEAVNPKIGTSKSALIAKSKTLCTHINANESDLRLDRAATKEFTNGSWVPSPSEAQAIVGTVKAYAGC